MNFIMYFPLYLSIYFYLFISLGATINLPALKKMEEIEEEEEPPPPPPPPEMGLYGPLPPSLYYDIFIIFLISYV